MPYKISSQSVTDGVSLSISKLKLVYSSLIFVDDKLTLVCLLTWQRLVAVSVRNTQVIQLIWRDQHHHAPFVIKFSKFSSPQAARGHWPPITKIMLTFLLTELSATAETFQVQLSLCRSFALRQSLTESEDFQLPNCIYKFHKQSFHCKFPF